MAAAIELVFEAEDQDLLLEPEEEVILEAPDALADLAFWYGVPLGLGMGDPDAGTSPFFAVDSWVPLRAYTADQVDTLIGSGGALTFGDIGGALDPVLQLAELSVPLGKLASPVYTQTQTDAAIASLADAVAATFDTLTFAGIDGTLGWARLADVPATFAPSAHMHPWSDLSGFVGSSLAQFATRNYSDLQGVPLTFAPAAHVHAGEDITSGTLPSGRLSGTYTGVTGLGTLTGLVVAGAAATVIGHAAPLALGDPNVLGGTAIPTAGFLATTNSGQVGIGRWSTTLTDGPALVASRSMSAAIGGVAAVTAGARLFTLAVTAADGGDLGTRAGSLRWEAESTATANRVATRLLINLAAGLADDDSREVARWTSSGTLLIGTTSETGTTAGGIRAVGASVLGATAAAGGTISAGAVLEANSATGSNPITPVGVRSRSRSNSGGWLTGVANFWSFFDHFSDDSNPNAAGVRARFTAHFEDAAGSNTGVGIWVGPLGAPTIALTISSAGAALFAGSAQVTGGFGCNTKAPQGAFASGGALNAYAAGANGLGTGANMSALHALVVAMRAALVADGIMS